MCIFVLLNIICVIYIIIDVVALVHNNIIIIVAVYIYIYCVCFLCYSYHYCIFTTTTPTVAFFTAVSHEYRKPLAKGAEFEPLIANVDCYGCMADVPAPNTEYSCRRGDVACVNSFDAKLVLDKIEKFL